MRWRRKKKNWSKITGVVKKWVTNKGNWVATYIMKETKNSEKQKAKQNKQLLLR